MNRNFWRGRRVFVTGHTGFKGSWLLLLLDELGATVSGLSLPPPTEPNLFDLLDLGTLCAHDRRDDIRDLAAVSDALGEADPEIVIHMAAQPLVRASYDDPVGTYATNVMGSVHVMEACRRLPDLRALLMITTDKCYDNVGWTWGYRENDRLGGADPYSNSKAACELAVEAYRRSFFSADGAAGLASARAGNVIGGGDFAVDRLVPDAMRAFMAGDATSIRNPLAVRPWQHVLDALAGYLLLVERLFADPAAAQGWNFGPQTNESATVGHVMDRLAAFWGAGAHWTQDPADHPHEAATLKLDSTKARVELGWAPRLDLDGALRITTDWYRDYHAGEDLMALTRAQIRSHLN